MRESRTNCILATIYDLEQQQTPTTRLMHDLAKCFKPQRLLHMPYIEGLILDDNFCATPHLLHADVSAIVALDTFGLLDRQVLNPIAHPTLGRPNMSKLSHLIFLADTLESRHCQTASLQALKQVSRENISQGGIFELQLYYLKKWTVLP
ncbi:MAG: bis(5'-nucleosyl)-tetraphosphatase (symmetrical) YqeK [Cyanobacteria bacterium J06635_10]